MKKITYLLGAGASYHSLPLIATMSCRMTAYCTYLKIALKKGGFRHDFAQQFIKELDNLIKAEKESTSIDAYAKELTNANKQMELLHLKALLSSYLIFEQLIKPDDFKIFLDENQTQEYDEETSEMVKTYLDPRYRTFWAEYLASPRNLPPNIRIVSWNYDMQLEFAYSRFTQHSLELVQQDLQIFPSEQKHIDIDKFCILKLNGTAGLIDSSGSYKFINSFDLNKHHLNADNLKYLITLLKVNYERAMSEPVFYFAWENEEVSNKTRSYAKDVLDTTDILVIIGYSFPSFNRTVDRGLFKNVEKINKVYYQAPKDNIEYLKLQMEGVNTALSKNAIFVNNLESFFIPPER